MVPSTQTCQASCLQLVRSADHVVLVCRQVASYPCVWDVRFRLLQLLSSDVGAVALLSQHQHDLNHGALVSSMQVAPPYLPVIEGHNMLGSSGPALPAR